MSLWYESLHGYGTGHFDPAADHERRVGQAQHILYHLAMDVPRHWWQGILENGELLAELHKLPEFADVDAGLLIALAFVAEGPAHGTPAEDPAALLASAREVLKARPELAEMGKQIVAGVP